MLTPDKTGLAWIEDLTGGWNVTDAPQMIRDDQCQIAENIEWDTTRFAQRRRGGQNVISTSSPWGVSTSLRSLLVHTPDDVVTTSELWGVDNQVTPVIGRLAAGNQFVAVPLADPFSLGGFLTQRVSAVSFNGKFFIAYSSGVNRLHVWDGSVLRRVGVATPAGPGAANTGAGTYPAVKRWYKVQWRNASVSPNVNSELSVAVEFTPSGAGTGVTISRPALANEGETHWRVFGSPDGVNYYVLSTPTIATTSITDTTAPANYPNAQPILAGFPSAAGYYTPPISGRYLVVDGARLLMAGSWMTPALSSRVMWTPILGTSPAFGTQTIADDERMQPDDYLDVDPSEGGVITGFIMFQDAPHIFKVDRIYKLVRTGQATQAYRLVDVSRRLGTISHRSLCVGEDDQGNECLYFLSKKGPARVGPAGVELIGRDLDAFWRTVNVTTNELSGVTLPFGIWYDAKSQVQWWVTVGGGSSPTHKIVFHAKYGHRTAEGVRGGWALHTDGAAQCVSAAMFSTTLGANMSVDQKPYCGQTFTAGQTNGACIQYDADGVITDRGVLATAYSARLRSKAFPPGSRGTRGGILDTYVIATPMAGQLTVSLIRDFGLETRAGAVSLLPASTESRLQRPVDDVGLADADYAALQVDDAGLVVPANTNWSVDAVGLRLRVEGHR